MLFYFVACRTHIFHNYSLCVYFLNSNNDIEKERAKKNKKALETKTIYLATGHTQTYAPLYLHFVVFFRSSLRFFFLPTKILSFLQY